MNFQQLRHFVVTAQAGNIIKAAQLLNISQSGLSRSISALEHQIGLSLFERSPKGVTLTQLGEHFLPGAQLMLNEYRRYVDELKAFRDLRAGSITLGINHSFAYFLMPDVLAKVLKRWPRIQISIVTSNYQALVDQLLTGDLDLALSLYTPGSMHEELRYEPLHQTRTVVLARDGHPLLAQDSVSVEELQQGSWALIKGTSALRNFAAFFEQAGIEAPHVSLRCASVALLASVVGRTDLLTILPEELTGSDFTPHLRSLPVTEVFGIATVGLIRRQGTGDLPIGEKLANAIRAEFDRLQDAHSDPAIGN